MTWDIWLITPFSFWSMENQLDQLKEARAALEKGVEAKSFYRYFQNLQMINNWTRARYFYHMFLLKQSRWDFKEILLWMVCKMHLELQFLVDWTSFERKTLGEKTLTSIWLFTDSNCAATAAWWDSDLNKQRGQVTSQHDSETENTVADLKV